jgi:hypothetical protein
MSVNDPREETRLEGREGKGKRLQKMNHQASKKERIGCNNNGRKGTRKENDQGECD